MSVKVQLRSPPGSAASAVRGPGGPQEYAKFKSSPGCEMLGHAIERLAKEGQLEAALEPKAFEMLGDAMRRLDTKKA